MLGHSSLSVTERYLHVSTSRLRAVPALLDRLPTK
jgi:site-specific recombinase XerD